MKSKKAMTLGEIVPIILIMVTLLLIIFAVKLWITTASAKEAELLCKDSVALRASTQFDFEAKGIKAQVQTPVMCKVIDEKISGKKEELMAELAEKMARCWEMFGMGQFEEILDADNIKIAFFGSSKLKNDCFVCYALIIDEKKIEGTDNYPAEGKITSEEMRDFLRNETHFKLNMTYLNYFQFAGGPGKIGIWTPTIEPGKSYAISFLAKNKKQENGWATGIGKMGASLGIAAVGLISGPMILIPSAGASYLTFESGWEAIKAEIYSEKIERDTSAIFLNDLTSAQKNCFEGDLAGH